MKKEDLKKWREATVDEINSRIAELQNQLYKLRHQLRIGQLKDFSIIKKTRREIAVLKTLIGEKNGSKKKGKG
ncbi:MAG TPA: 50S ribosomal protein L29 [bacterium]|nr:50S ribosomal protein L29 [bacterium]HPP29483.1 50S ribosomal protein L29 [bacterium]